jgi:mono/diheme cytochrome c family protein
MRESRTWVICGIALLVAAAAGAQTVKQGTAPRVQSVQGLDSYKAYCAVCHGEQARGDGPAATALKKVPADLTSIAKRHGGKFSPSDIEATIDGQNVMMSHGSRDMPIWGPVFKAIAPDDAIAKLRMTNLIDYLKGIQTQ